MRAESRFVRSYKLRFPRSPKGRWKNVLIKEICLSQISFRNRQPRIASGLRRITHNSIFADLLHLLDFDKFRRDDEIQNQTVKDQHSFTSVHAKIRSISELKKPGSPMSQKRRTLWGTPRSPHFSGTTTYCVASLRQTRFCTILQNLPRFEPALSAAARANA